MYAYAGTAHGSWETSTNDPSGSPPSIADLYSGARSRGSSLTLESVFNADLTRHVRVSVRVARDHRSLDLSLSLYIRTLFFFSFFERFFKLVKFVFFFFCDFVLLWKIFCVILQRLLYWFSLRGSPRDIEAHKDLFLWLYV